MSMLDRNRGQRSSHNRSASETQHSPQPSRSYKFLDIDPSISREESNNHVVARRDRDGQYLYASDVRKEDNLSPLPGPSRRGRARVDSFNSIGSSVAPAALPHWQQHTTRSQFVQRGQSREGSRIDPHASHTKGMQSSQSGMSLSSAQANGGGLEAWLQSQAGGSNDAHAPSSRIRKMHAVDEGEIGSDAGRSTGARSAGYMMNGAGSSRRKREGRYRSPVPEWDPSALDADAAGLGGHVIPDTQSKLDSVLRWRSNSTTKTPHKDRLDVTDFDSQIAPENRRRRREVGASSFSAGGMSISREGVRRSRITQAEPSLDALLSSVRNGIDGLPSGISQGSPFSKDFGIHSKSRFDTAASPLRSFMRWFFFDATSGPTASGITAKSSGSSDGIAILALTILITMLFKWITGLGSWSGKGVSPVHGDLEAQRHWMEVTLHLPRSQWYYYDLKYWGLDYPPLTALISRWCAQIGVFLWPNLTSSLALDTSRGNESSDLIFFMRMTVLICDLVVYTPAILFFLSRKLQGRGRRTRAIAVLTVLLQPSLLLIDYGHFQYNTIMLGLSAASFALLFTSLPNPDLSSLSEKNRDEVRRTMASLSRKISYEYIAAAVFFSLSLCFKQMALYYAPAVFAVMLGRCWGLARVGLERGLTCFFGIALATSLTFAIVFRPWITSLSQLQQIFQRIFPLARGLFEDKVSNIWCFLTVLPVPSRYKLRNLLSIEKTAKLSLITTLLVIILPCIHLFVAAVETVRIEMFLDQDLQRQMTISEKRQREGSVTGSVRTSRARAQSRATPSEAGTDLASILSGHRGSIIPRNHESKLNGRIEGIPQSLPLASSSPSPAASVLPYALLSTSLAFYLFGFQTHEKSILLPLLPLTIIISTKGDEWGAGAGKTDWEWAILTNNIAAFSMWPLLQRDGLTLQYMILLLLWIWVIGHRPFQRLQDERNTFVAWLGAFAHTYMIFLHIAEMIFPLLPKHSSKVLIRYPDLFPVFNVLFCTPLLVIVWLWSMKRQLEVGLACGIDIFSFVRASKSSKVKAKKL